MYSPAKTHINVIMLPIKALKPSLVPPLYSNTKRISAAQANIIFAALLPSATNITTARVTIIAVLIEKMPIRNKRRQVMVALAMVAMFTNVFTGLDFFISFFCAENSIVKYLVG
jgi:hypothetical protein